MEEILDRLKSYRNELYRFRESFINLNNNTAMGHPITKSKIEVYE